MEKQKKIDTLTFEKVLSNDFELIYKIDEELARRYESLISFSRGRDFNNEIKGYIISFVENFKKFLTPENTEGMNDRLVNYNKLVVDLKTKILQSTKIPSIMIAGGANYPTQKKERELERTHELEAELYSEDGKHQKFLNNTNKMFNPLVIKHNREQALKKQDKAHANGWVDCSKMVEHDEIVGYGIDIQNNRLYIVTDGKPTEETRLAFKKFSFRWSPKNQRWQRILTKNAIYSLKNLFKDFGLEVDL